MAYSAVHVFGDSLVDSGNVLKLAEFVDDLPLSSLPDGTPTAEKGYYLGRFSNGLNFADLIANKFLGVPTVPVFRSAMRILSSASPSRSRAIPKATISTSLMAARILDGGVPTSTTRPTPIATPSTATSISTRST